MDPTLWVALNSFQKAAFSHTAEGDDGDSSPHPCSESSPESGESFEGHDDASDFSAVRKGIGQSIAATGMVCCTFAPAFAAMGTPVGCLLVGTAGVTGAVLLNFVAPSIYTPPGPKDFLDSVNEHFSTASMGMDVHEYDSPGDIESDEIMTMLHEANFKQDFGAAIRDSQTTYSSVTKKLHRASNGGCDTYLDEVKRMLTKKYEDLESHLEPQGCLGKSTIIEATKRALKERNEKEALSIFERLMHARAKAYAMTQTKLQLEIAECPEQNQGKVKLLQDKSEDFQDDHLDIKAAMHQQGLPISHF